jgi:hypothetical protein
VGAGRLPPLRRPAVRPVRRADGVRAARADVLAPAGGDGGGGGGGPRPADGRGPAGAARPGPRVGRPGGGGRRGRRPCSTSCRPTGRPSCSGTT